MYKRTYNNFYKEKQLKILKKEMRLKRINAKTLAKKIGVSKTTINNWLTGKCLPSFENMDTLCALGFSQTACLAPSMEVEIKEG